MPHFVAGNQLLAEDLNDATHQGFGLIEERIIPSDMNAVTVSNIDQSFSNLWVIVTAGPNGTSERAAFWRFNNDTTNSYDNYRFEMKNDGGINGFRDRDISEAQIGFMAPDLLNNVILTVHGYSRTDRQKTWSGYFTNDVTSGTNAEVEYTGTFGVWQNTSAITEIDFLIATDSYLTGSLFQIYGIG